MERNVNELYVVCAWFAQVSNVSEFAIPKDVTCQIYVQILNCGVT